MTAVTYETFDNHLLQGALQACAAFLDGVHVRDADRPLYWRRRADVLYRASEFAQALDIYVGIGTDFPGYVDHRYQLADVCSHLGLPQVGNAELRRLIERAGLAGGLAKQILAEGWQALAMDKEVIELGADSFQDELNRHVQLLMRGQSQMRSSGIADGIDAYRAGYCTPDAWRALHSMEPAGYWHGQRALPRHLTVRSRGGMGDLLQWVRYVQVLESWGVQVEIPGLNPQVLQRVPAATDAFASNMDAHGYRLDDAGAPMWTDPFTLFSTLFPVVGFAPSGRYIEPAPVWRPADVMRDIRRRARGRPCVGLFWSCNESPAPFGVKSLKLQHLCRLLDMSDMYWVIFQRGYQGVLWREDERSLDTGHFTTLDGSLSFEQSIALGGQLDALVSVDTGLVHGCAALGLPCVLMANPATDWRWQKGALSDWYPTVSIARSPRLGAWDELVGATADVLRDVVHRPGCNTIHVL